MKKLVAIALFALIPSVANACWMCNQPYCDWGWFGHAWCREYLNPDLGNGWCTHGGSCFIIEAAPRGDEPSFSMQTIDEAYTECLKTQGCVFYADRDELARLESEHGAQDPALLAWAERRKHMQLALR